MLLDLEERDRRYELVRDKMSAMDLDALIVAGNVQIYHKGFVRYLSNYSILLYGALIIFPRHGEAKFLAPSPLQEYWTKRLSWIKDVEISPIFGEGLVKNLKAMGLSKGKLGLINDKIMSADTYSALIKNCPDATIVDATNILEQIRMVKSQKEQQLSRISAKIADLSFEVLAKIVKPGVAEREVLAEVDRQLSVNGAECIFHMFSADPNILFPLLPTERIIQEGDVILMNTELSGPEGYWTQIMRTSFVGSPKKNVERMYDTLLKIRSQIFNELYPNRKVSDIAKGIRKSILDAGYDVGVHFGHCLGLDVVERPLVHLDDETPLAPGMTITVHPQLVSRAENATVIIGDTFLITDNEPELLTKTDPLAIKTLG